MVNCTNSGLGIPVMFPGVGDGVVLVGAACVGGDAEWAVGCCHSKTLVPLVVPPCSISVTTVVIT